MRTSYEDLLAGLKRGDKSAFKELVDTFYVPLCAYSVQFTDSQETSEDIVQDFFVQLWEHHSYTTIQGNLKTFLFHSVRNASIDNIRKRQQWVFTELEEEAYTEEYDMQESDVERRRELLHRYLHQLSPQEYKVLIEIVVHNRKYKEVAEEMGISVNTVKTHLRRALVYLRSCPFALLVLFSSLSDS